MTRDDGHLPLRGVVNTNVFDWDGDYVVTVTDFLMMLSVYGDTDVDLDGVWDSGDDCVDTNACNYADPSETYIDILGVCGDEPMRTTTASATTSTTPLELRMNVGSAMAQVPRKW